LRWRRRSSISTKVAADDTRASIIDTFSSLMTLTMINGSVWIRTIVRQAGRAVNPTNPVGMKNFGITVFSVANRRESLRAPNACPTC
jgi:hypothetical protein